MTKKIATNKGFTLAEVVIVLVILGIISGFGAPALSKAYKNFNLRGEVRDLYSMLQKAKITAIKENESVVIQFSPQTYTADGGVGSYYIFVDDGDGAGVAGNDTQDGTEEILANVTMPGGISLYSSTFAGTPSYTSFNGRGLPGNKGSIEIRNTTRWFKISVSTANINMEISNDGTF